jgi:hypothetical protein
MESSSHAASSLVTIQYTARAQDTQYGSIAKRRCRYLSSMPPNSREEIHSIERA